MTWFPNISDYSPPKVGNVVKQDKTKQQEKRAEEEDRHDDEQEKTTEENKKKNDGLLDIYV
ncbi:hypothetical protein G5S52_10105 [Grimontia sp. S25]|uniref:Uncharacterized protein n=1 Tax=Grimontia sedimenti TaxID=2711294 RepID=A0A6M1R774_9GAMM|nr:hypothetical protein [Grimontia sedimenti]NGN97993.1 hypothetical protein [Grimontia sedimenti]